LAKKLETGLELDFSEFDRKFKKITEDMLKAAEKGLFEAMNQLLTDAIEEPPQAPFELGDLWGSPAGTVKTGIEGNHIFAIGGFNIEYAARWHEAEPGTIKWTKTGAKQPGPKYLQSKMIRNKDKYMWITARSIKKALK